VDNYIKNWLTAIRMSDFDQRFIRQSRNSPHFMEPECSSPSSQQPYTTLWPESVQYSLHQPITRCVSFIAVLSTSSVKGCAGVCTLFIW